MKTIFISVILVLIRLVSISQELSLQTGHTAQINSLKFTKDNLYLISVGNDNRVIMWDLRTLMQMKTLIGHRKKVNCVAVCPTDKFFATASDDKTVILWQYPTGKKIKVFNFSKEVKSIVFSPDGNTLACATDSIFFIDLKTYKIKTLDKKARKFFNALAFSPNGSYFAFGGKNEYYTYIYVLEYEYVLKKIIARPSSLSFTNDSKSIITAGVNGTIKVRSLISKDSKYKRAITSNNYWDGFNDIVIRNKYLLSPCSNGLLYLYDIENDYERVEVLEQIEDNPICVDISSDAIYAASGGKKGEIYLWNLKNLELVKVLKGQLKSINSFDFSSDGNLMFIAYNDGSLKMWDLKNKSSIIYNPPPKLNFFQKYQKKEYTALYGTNINPQKVQVVEQLNSYDRINRAIKHSIQKPMFWNISEDGKNIFLENNKTDTYKKYFVIDTFKIIEVEFEATHLQEYSFFENQKIVERQKVFNSIIKVWITNKPIRSKKFNSKDLYLSSSIEIEGDMYFINVADSGKYAIMLFKYLDSTICQIWDIEQKNRLNIFPIYGICKYAIVDNKGKFAAFANDSIVFLYDISTEKLLQTFEGTSPIVFSNKNNYFAFADNNNFVNIFDLKTEKKLLSVPSYFQTEITDIKFNIPYSYLAASSYDGLIKLWSLKTYEPIVNLASFGKSDFIFINNQNYYYSTKKAIQNIAFLMNDNLFTFEQFDILYNRPDTIFSVLPYSEPKEIDVYKKVYKKRLQKMKYASTSSFAKVNIPKLYVLNLDSMPTNTTNEQLTIKIRASDSLYNIHSINIWVNNIPVFGVDGYRLEEKQKIVDKCLEITLNQGINNIDVSCLNSKGIESFKKSFTVFCQKQTQPTLYIIAVGISKFLDTTLNLNFADKDANDFITLFSSNKIFKNKRTIKLTNQQATLENILNIKDTLKQTNVDDVVLLFYAGHGLLDNFYNYFLPLYNFNYNNFFETAISYDDFVNILDSIPARQKVAFIDACHSGEFDKSEQISDVLINNQKNNNYGERSLWRSTQSYSFSQNSFEMMKTIFADLRRGNGAVVISSASAQEFAYESDYIKNGIFTYLLIEGIKNQKADLNRDNILTINELQSYITNTVPLITKGRQNPTSRQENLKNDFYVWKYSKINNIFKFAKKQWTEEEN